MIIIKKYRVCDVYKSHCYLVQYNDNYFKIVLNKFQKEKGFEKTSKINPYKKIEDFMCGSSNITTDEEIERISLSRTKRIIKELALCNNFEYFATITINSKNCDRYSLIECQKKLKCKLQTIKKRHNRNFKYLFITEKHKDGAFHFHRFSC